MVKINHMALDKRVGNSGFRSFFNKNCNNKIELPETHTFEGLLSTKY